MTTIEATNSLIAACQNAGVNGVIRRDGISYIVGQDDSGEWTLSLENGPTEPISTYVTDSWTVVSTTRDGEEDLGEFDEDEDEDDEETPTVTVRDFFLNLTPWTFVRGIGGSTEWLFGGVDWDVNGKEIVKLLHTRYLNDAILQEDTLALENSYEAVTLGDGTAKTADRLTYQLVRHLRSTRNEVEHITTRYEDTAEKLSKAQQDFRTVNRKINEYAESMNMCSDYERRIYGWNDDMVSLKLEGRENRHFTFYVPVRIPTLGEQQFTVLVNGAQTGIRTPDQAREYVERMSSIEILRNLYDSGIQLEVNRDEERPVDY